ncbi:MAG TPA: prenyltransferase/squalene oxidase repeat-containing protein [Bryobacteraceae bacterium]|jgi:hypothetical protein|nr:prenyltransferase/squalene oxidase repeat-containing protein [Bryobacteraceae bacterium]
MSDPSVLRLDYLRKMQNPDGGWGFFPGKHSWLEPTAYALMALHGEASSRESFERGWNLMRSWQMKDGSWKPCAVVGEAHWTTALCVTLHCLNGVHDDALRRGVDWLLDTTGAENGLKFRLVHMLVPSTVELDPSLKAWPWRPGNSSWIEPTAHALVALKKVVKSHSESKLQDRIRSGEKMILERRCGDGGWNYGNRKVLGEALPSYPETTALALLGLAGNGGLDLAAPLAVARKFWQETRSPLARAWLRVALRSHGVTLPELEETPLTPNDILIQALEAIAAKGVMA